MSTGATLPLLLLSTWAKTLLLMHLREVEFTAAAAGEIPLLLLLLLTPHPCVPCSEREVMLGMSAVSFITIFFLTRWAIRVYYHIR